MGEGGVWEGWGERWVRGGEGCQPLRCPEGGKLDLGCLASIVLGLDQPVPEREGLGSVIRSLFPLGKIK